MGKIVFHLALPAAIIAVLSACGPGNIAYRTPEAGKKEVAFRSFLKKFPMLSLPLNLNPDVGLDHSKTEHLLDIITEPGDSQFVDSFGLQFKEKAYGILPDTSNCFHVIWLVPVTVYHPVLATYTKTGELISVDVIYIGKCGSDECVHCNENTIIDNDYRVYMADTFLNFQCDQPPSDTDKAEVSVIYRTGRIPATGKPEFSEEKDMDITDKYKRSLRRDKK